MERLNFRLIAPLASAIVSSATYVAAAQPRDFFVEETHFRCYIVSQQTPQAATTVTLTDQFLENVTLTVNEPLQFCAPTSKNGVEITRAQEEEHLTMYGAAANLVPHLIVETVDQFGPRTLEAANRIGDIGQCPVGDGLWCLSRCAHGGVQDGGIQFSFCRCPEAQSVCW
jgi:hypothetical protein